MTLGDRAQRAIGAMYSWTSDRVYDRLVVNGGFRLFGGRLNELVLDQGASAAAAAGGLPILDVPVGTAYFTSKMSPLHDGLVVGADLAWGMVAEARRAAHRSLASNLTPVQADIHSLPFKEGSFRAVLCNNGLQVIPDLSGALDELARVLAPGGVLYLSVILASAGALLPASVEKRLPTMLRSGPAITEEVARAGLTVVSVVRSRFAYLMEATKS